MNTQFVFSSPKFDKFMKFITSKDSKVAKFFQSKICKKVQNVKTKYFNNKTMSVKLNDFKYIISSSNIINQEITIRYLIPSDYECTVPGDACSSGGGAFCDEF